MRSSLTSLAVAMRAGEHETFTAVYRANEAGTDQTVTVAQDPPKALFSAGTGAVIDTGSSTYYCTVDAGRHMCVSAGSSDPLAAMSALVSPTAVLSELSAAQTELEDHAPGYTSSYSSGTFAGQRATCVTIASSFQSARYCVTRHGILAYEGAEGNSISLVTYSSTVTAGDFTVPAGATVESIPSGMSIQPAPR